MGCGGRRGWGGWGWGVLRTSSLPSWSSTRKTPRNPTPTGEGQEQQAVLTMDDVLLRGCMLKNSHYVIGVVMYTGPESRIQKNASKTPIKIGTCIGVVYRGALWVFMCVL